MLKLYHGYLSVCAQKARLGLAEKGLEWESQLVDLQKGEQQTPEYLKLNPKGVIPTLIHDGRVIRESNVLIEYLDEVFPTPPLKPDDPYDRAQMRIWMKRLDEGHHDVATAVMSQAVSIRHRYLAMGIEEATKRIEGQVDPIKRERRRSVIFDGVESPEFATAINMWRKLFDDMEIALAETGHLAGASYSLADLAWTPYFVRLEQLTFDRLMEGYPNIAKWFAMVKARPCYREAIDGWSSKAHVDNNLKHGAEAWERVKELFDAAA